MSLNKFIATRTSMNGQAALKPLENSRAILAIGSKDFLKHEDFILSSVKQLRIWRGQTGKAIIIFDHFSDSIDFGMRLKEHAPELKFVKEHNILGKCVVPGEISC